jgi:hypothetical protein
MRNYRATLGKWQTSDPLGYPDGWNQLVYCNNGVTSAVDLWGCDAYDPNGLTSDELRQLNGAIEMWLLDANTVVYPLIWLKDRTLTLSFLTRYMHKSGDQTLDYSVVSGEQAVIDANTWVIEQVREGDRTPRPYSISGGQWQNIDLSSSIGGCLIYYAVTTTADAYIIDCWIDDPYDFHDNGLTVNFPWLGFEGLLFGWDGGETIYDRWMQQLAEAEYAKVFNTKISWQLTVKE